MVERFVPEASLRNAHHDSVQLEADAAEQRTAHRMAFGSPPGSSGAPAVVLSPLGHFIERLLAVRARRGVIENPVVYRSGLGRIHVYPLERDVYIVNAELDRYYRKRIESILMQYDDSRGDPWLLQEIRRSTYDEEQRECDEAAKCEIIPAAAHHASSSSTSAPHFKPNDWIIYTRNSGNFVRQLGAALARDTLFDSATISLQDLAGSAVSFDVVAFLCGTDETFVDTTRAPEDAATTTTTVCIDMPQTTEPVHVGARAAPMRVEEGRSLGHGRASRINTKTTPQSVALNVTLAGDNEWIALPVWTWTMRSNDTRGARPLHTTSDLIANMQTFDTALIQCIQRLQAMDPDGRLSVADVHALRTIQAQVNAVDRFIGAIDPSSTGGDKNSR